MRVLSIHIFFCITTSLYQYRHLLIVSNQTPYYYAAQCFNTISFVSSARPSLDSVFHIAVYPLLFIFHPYICSIISDPYSLIHRYSFASIYSNFVFPLILSDFGLSYINVFEFPSPPLILL